MRKNWAIEGNQLSFQEGIKPMWEDESNRRGGRWLINLDKKQRVACLDYFWLEIMLCLIGNKSKKLLKTCGCYKLEF